MVRRTLLENRGINFFPEISGVNLNDTIETGFLRGYTNYFRHPPLLRAVIDCDHTLIMSDHSALTDILGLIVVSVQTMNF